MLLITEIQQIDATKLKCTRNLNIMIDDFLEEKDSDRWKLQKNLLFEIEDSVRWNARPSCAIAISWGVLICRVRVVISDTHFVSLSKNTRLFGFDWWGSQCWFSSFMVSTIYTVERSMKPTCFGCFSSVIIKVDSDHNELMTSICKSFFNIYT